MSESNDPQAGRRLFIQRSLLAAAGSCLLPGVAAQAAETAPAAASAASSGTEPASPSPTVVLAQYGAGLRYEVIPAPVLQRAKDCMTDAVATIIYGADLPWSKMIIAYVRQNGSGGRSQILGAGTQPVHPPGAALAQAAMAHAFELDNLTKPDSGAHPGAALFSSGLAVAQDRGLGGRALLTAFVAGAETMIRIGYATEHTNEERGFHAPGTTGPFGSAITVGHLLGLDAGKMTNALGVAGSCAGGLLAFAHAGNGAMVKRLNVGRGAEGGVLAASLAAEGFTGPSTVLEGEGGFLRAFCPQYDLSQLTLGLGQTYETMNIMIKRYACHITAHTPVEAMLDLRRAHGFAASDVASIEVAGSPRMATVNNIAHPADALLAQFSIPFCVALSLYRNPVDPRSFDANVIHDNAIMAMTQRVRMTAAPGQRNDDLASTVTVTLNDGRVFSERVTAFTGTPERPLDRAGLREKFMLLTRDHPEAAMSALFDRLQNIEQEHDLAWLRV
ncbi:2-methylcitrate dehydratase PrpD [Paraburkholderia sp. GAS199]|uniref:MmgE/PrpD family protein n=1 Tax=Paraburkholderia sp. GAS199 TaxID=3035126 RepID=UPI003D1CD2F0